MKTIILVITCFFVLHSGFSQICLGTTIGNTKICNGQSITLTAKSSPGCTVPLNVTWVKYVGVWQSIGSGTTITVNPTQNTQYGCYTSSNPTNIPNIYITVDNPLVAPTIISNSPLTICNGNTVNLSSSVSGTVTYQWKNNNINIGTNTNTYDAATSGNYTLDISNACGSVSSSNSINVVVNTTPANAGVISGEITVCQGQNSANYSVPSIANATSYIWTLPTGATGTSTINSITLNYGASAASGNISVKGNNSCGDGLTSTLPIMVNPLPSNAGVISGATTVCQGQNSVTYSVPSITNTTSYIWTLPTGVIGTSSTNSITLNYGAYPVSGNIIVKGKNSCGNGTTSSLPITVISTPQPTGNISQNFIQGQTLNDLQVIGNNLTWYANQSDANNHVSPIVNSTLLVNGVTYYVTQTNNGCEGIPLSITVIETLSLNDFQKERFVYYPNPVQNILHIDIEKDFSGTILDIIGKTLMNVTTKDIDVSSLNAGIYVLDIISEGNHYTKKIIKQ